MASALFAMFEFVQNNKIVIQVILGAVALTFVGFGVSSYNAAEDPYLVKVGSTKIFKRDVDRALEGQTVNPASQQATLDNLIRQELLLAAAHDAGANVTPAELRNVIAAIPAFQQDGKFSTELYKAFLASRNMSPEAFEERVSRDVLLQNQLNSIIGSQFTARTIVSRVASIMGESREVKAWVLQPAGFAAQVKTDATAIKAFYDANKKRFVMPEAVKLDYVTLSAAELSQNIPVSDAEVQKYYDDHKADFTGNEERRASHILLTVPKGASAEQKAKIKAQAEALLKEVWANPAKFADIAKAKSQDTGSAANGGDLGFFGHGTMVKPFDDVVFRMKPGQISEVVETEFGFHIIKLDEVKGQDFAAVKDAVATRLKQQKASALFRTQSDKLTDVAYQQGDSLQGVQAALKLDVHHSDWVSKSQPGKDAVASNPKVLAAAFTDDVLKKKHNSEPIDIGNNTLVVVRVADHQPEQLQPIAAVEGQIKAELIARDGAKLVEQKGAQSLAALQAGKADVAAVWSETKTVSRRDLASLPPADVRAIFAASVARLPSYAGVKHENGDYVIYQVGKVIAAPPVSAEDNTRLAGLIDEMSANSLLSNYLQALRQKYKIVGGSQKLSDQ